MANWSDNVWRFKGDPAVVEDAMAALGLPANQPPQMTFEKLDPMPPILKRIHIGSMDIDGERVTRWMVVNGTPRCLAEEEIAEAVMTGHPDWCDWAYEHWGTKWGPKLLGTARGDGGEMAVVVFETANGSPLPILKMMRERFPAVKIEGEYREEGCSAVRRLEDDDGY